MQIVTFRSIALLPIINKIFEKNLCQKLSLYFNKNKLFNYYAKRPNKIHMNRINKKPH